MSVTTDGESNVVEDSVTIFRHVSDRYLWFLVTLRS